MISRASGLPRRPPIAPHPASSLARHQDRQVVVHQLRDLVPGQPAPAHLNRVAPPDQVRAARHNRASRDLSNTHLLEAKMMFLDCPAYLDPGGAVRCGLPAEIPCRLTMRSTDGPPESVMIRCPAGRWFNGPIQLLTWEDTDKHDPGTAGAAARAGRDSPRGSHNGGDGRGQVYSTGLPTASREFPGATRSRLLPGTARPPVDHRHASAPQPHHTRSPDASRHRRREATRVPARCPPYRRSATDRAPGPQGGPAGGAR